MSMPRLMAPLGAAAVLATAFLALPPATRAAASPAVVSACGAASAGHVRCFALVAPHTATAGGGSISGYTPAQLRAAYHLPASGAAGQTVAIVDAMDDPTAASDLAKYRSTFGLPPCTVADGCFRKLNEYGRAGSYPPADPGWDVEISLDLDMVSAACPSCHIVLLEASTNFDQDLAHAENTAARLRPAAISNSYGGSEFNGMQQFASAYRHAGMTIVAASGDFGFGPANFPAVLSSVIAVGGTSLQPANNHRGWTEQAWSQGSSGCSAYIAKPAWQHDGHCSMRTVADVSADADPYPGLAVYDTSIPPGYDGLTPGWITVGGTSASAPFVAGVIGLAGNGGTITPGFVYSHGGDFFDVIGGSNGYCGGDYLCTALRGYDAPTGVGTPDGDRGL